MGALTFIAAGAAALLASRFLPVGRKRHWLLELSIALAGALLFGAAATALDFGGWAEADWRAALFSFCGAMAAVGASRISPQRK